MGRVLGLVGEALALARALVELAAIGRRVGRPGEAQGEVGGGDRERPDQPEPTDPGEPGAEVGP